MVLSSAAYRWKIPMPLHRKKPFLAAVIIILPSAFATFLFFTLRSHPSKVIPPSERLAQMPPIILWAWERPEDLRFINPREVGIAVLANTVQLAGADAHLRQRMQPMASSKDASVIAVTRIETSRENRPVLSIEQRDKIIAAVLQVTRNPRTVAVQIDFDALESERGFYKNLLIELRNQLPAEMPLSMTALASWCLYDNWIDDLPVDEAVPMLFRMGVDTERVRAAIEAGGNFRSSLAQQSVGISTDEPLSRLPSRRRVYIFSERAWTKEAADTIIREVKRWQ
jgi:hypothetical protein